MKDPWTIRLQVPVTFPPIGLRVALPMSSTPTTPTLSTHPEMEVDQHSQVGWVGIVEDLTVQTPRASV